jgi:hypothetical protein
MMHIIIAKTMDFSSEVSPITKITDTAAYKIYLPILVIVNFIIWFYAGFAFFYDDDFETAKEIRKVAIRLSITWFILTIMADIIIWLVLPLPMQLTFDDKYTGYGWLYILIYLMTFIGAMLGVRPTYLQHKRIERNRSNN